VETVTRGDYSSAKWKDTEGTEDTEREFPEHTAEHTTEDTEEHTEDTEETVEHRETEQRSNGDERRRSLWVGSGAEKV
jgi:hypothetical protein